MVLEVIFTGACMKTLLYITLLGCFWECEILYEDLARSSPGSFTMILWDSLTGHWPEDLGQGLLQVFVERSCEDPVEILIKRSLH